MLSSPKRSHDSGVTRTDLLAGLGVVGVLGLLTWPGLAHSRERSSQLVCASNLQRIGYGFQLWGNDHSEVLPWRLPAARGGTLTASRVGNAWFEFAWASNYLVSPRILVCPADEGTRKIASDFSNNPNSGFLHFNFRANALSYALGLDPFPALPASWLASDRNLRVDASPVACSSGINNGAGLFAGGQAAWTNGVHEVQGNILLFDGRVLQTSTQELAAHLRIGNDNGAVHVLMPR